MGLFQFTKGYLWHFEGLEIPWIDLRKKKLKIPSKSLLFAVRARPRTSYAPSFLTVTILLLTYHIPQFLAPKPALHLHRPLSITFVRLPPKRCLLKNLRLTPQSPCLRWLKHPPSPSTATTTLWGSSSTFGPSRSSRGDLIPSLLLRPCI